MLRRQERAGRTGRGTRGGARDVRGRRGTTEPEQHQPTHLDDDDEPNEGVSILDQEGESGNESDDFQETLDEQLAFHHSPPRMPGQLGEPSQTTAGMDTTTSVNTDTGALEVERLRLHSPLQTPSWHSRIARLSGGVEVRQPCILHISCI